MNVAKQLLHGAVLATLAPGKMSARSWARAGLYALLAALILGAIGAAFATQETSLRRFLESFLFPESYHPAVDFFIEYIVRSQSKQIVANALVTFTMVLVSLVLFWAKERVSKSYEEDAGLGDASQWHELSFFREAFEELKLLLLNIALLFIVLWLGHAAEPWRKTAATTLSYLTLFFTWSVDFAAPYMQRRQMRYSQIIAAIFRRPILSLSFGAVMSLPLVAVAHVAGASDWPALTTIIVLFGSNVLMIVWSSVAGTWVGARLHELAVRVRPAPGWARVAFWLVLAGVLGVGGWVGANLASSLATKSQILKCDYHVDWSSLEVGKPSLSGLLSGELSVAVSVVMAIDNPNDLAVVIEKNRLVASDDGVIVAESHLSPVTVPANGTKRERVTLDVTLRGKSLLQGASINPLAWDLILYVEITDAFEFPIYLRGGG